jgi:hypothetical protein
MTAPVRSLAHVEYSPVPIVYERRGFSWGAVALGLAIAIALDIFFLQLGIAFNLGFARSMDISAIAVGDAIAWVVTGLIALGAGAWAAGRLATAHTRHEGGMHGVAVWAAGAVIMLVGAVVSAGALGMGALGVVGAGLSGAGELAELAVPKWDDIKGELTGALARGDELELSAAGTVAAPANAARLRDRSRMMELAGKHFTVDAKPMASADRAELVTLMAAQLGLPNDEAERTLAQWDNVWAPVAQQYQAAKLEAAHAAEAARVVLIAAAGWAAVAMILGAVASFLAGSLGTRCRLEIELRRVATEHVDYDSRMRTAPLEPAV